MGLDLQTLSPPHSPSSVTSRVALDQGAPYTESVFVTECLTDSFETIDRAEMNKYLQPDHAAMGGYSVAALSSHNPALSSMSHISTTLVSTNSTSTSTGLGLTPGGPHSPSAIVENPTLTPLQNIPSPRMIYGGSSSPYIVQCNSPSATAGSPEAVCVGSTSPSASPDSAGDFVELQPPRANKDPLPPINGHKSVNPFLPQNICYQTYNYSYPYPYTMWHN